MAEHTWIDDVWIDVTVAQGHSLAMDITGSPVESGADMTHHVHEMPEVVTIAGLISNAPIEHPQSHVDGAAPDPAPVQIEGEPGLLQLPLVGGTVPGLGQLNAITSAVGLDLSSRKKLSVTALHWYGEFDRVRAVKDRLWEIARTGEPVTVITALHTYPSMVLSDVEFDLDGATGDALPFTVTARRVRIVDSATGEAVPDDQRSKGSQSAGKVDAQALPPGELGAVLKSGAASAAGL